MRSRWTSRPRTAEEAALLLESPPAHPAGRAENRPLRVLGVAALAVATAIHVLEFFDADTLTLAALLAASAAGTFAAVVLLLAGGPRSGWLVGGITSLLTLVTYCVTRTVGIPGVDPRAGIGNWNDPLGIMALIVEGLVIVVTVVALADVRWLGVRRAVAETRASTPRGPEEPAARPAGRRPATWAWHRRFPGTPHRHRPSH